MRYSVDYKSSLKSRHWRKLRRRVLRRDHYECRGCGRSSSILDLQVHHITYKLNAELRSELITFYPICHRRIHEAAEIINVI